MSIRALLSFCFALTLIAGCRTDTSEPPSIPDDAVSSVTDDTGRTLELALPVDRVLTLAPNLTELVYAVGGNNALIAASQADNFPADVQKLPQFSTFPLNHEQVVSFDPDVLLAVEGVNNPSDASALDELGIQTYFFAFDSIAAIPHTMRTLGSLLGVDGELPAGHFENRIDSLRSVVSTDNRPRALLLIDDVGLYAFGKDSFASEAIRLAGAENLTDSFDGSSSVPSVEFVLEQNPDVIILLTDDPDYSAASLLEQQPVWRQVSAIQNDRVHAVHPDLLTRPGPRLLQAIEELINHFHPEDQ